MSDNEDNVSVQEEAPQEEQKVDNIEAAIKFVIKKSQAVGGKHRGRGRR
jgi:hypothetical protein